MLVFHVKRPWQKLLVLTSAALVILCTVFLLPGCLEKNTASSDPIIASTPEQQITYLTQLGWQVETNPIETLDLQLPDDLKADYADYCKLQDEQHLPFSQFAGQTVKRYTYTVTNYPGIERGVQANLYLCGDQIIGGDIISTGEDGFQAGLSFPET